MSLKDIPVGIILSDDMKKMHSAAKVDGSYQSKPAFEYLAAQMSTTTYKNAESSWKQIATLAQVEGLSALGYLVGTWIGGFLGTLLGGPITVIGYMVSWFVGGRSMKVLIVNDTETDLHLTNPEDCVLYGNQVSEPSAGAKKSTIPRRLAATSIKDSTGKTLSAPGMAFYGCWAFEESRFLGIPTYGTEGGLKLGAQDQSVLPTDMIVAWTVPEAGSNNCAVSLSYTDVKQFVDDWIDGKKTPQSKDSSTCPKSNVKAHIAMEDLKKNVYSANLLVVITDGKDW